jgi:hypothetical protein
MAARVMIDPNIRVRGNQTYAGVEDVEGTVVAGSHVMVYERESGLTGPAEVTEVDSERQLVYLAVDWDKLREPARPAHPLRAFLDQAWQWLKDLGGEIQSARSARQAGHRR